MLPHSDFRLDGDESDFPSGLKTIGQLDGASQVRVT